MLSADKQVGMSPECSVPYSALCLQVVYTSLLLVYTVFLLVSQHAVCCRQWLQLTTKRTCKHSKAVHGRLAIAATTEHMPAFITKHSLVSIL
jgi:hypothetical protein